MSASDNLSPQQFTTLYHGTRAESVDSIRANGLTAPSGVDAAGWPMLTTSRAQAERYAIGEDPAVLEYHVPTELTNYRHEDALLWPGREHTAYNEPAVAHGLKRPIPGEYIAAVHRPGATS